MIEFETASWLYKDLEPLRVDPLLANSLDPGEAAVIQLALDKKVATVCIDRGDRQTVSQTERSHSHRFGRYLSYFHDSRSAWSTCSHSLAPIQISGRAAISWSSSSTSGKERIFER